MKYLKPFVFTLVLLAGCKEDPDPTDQWVRHTGNPIFRDPISGESYESASDPHVFFDDQGELQMIYSGDVNGKSSIKLAKGESWTEQEAPILVLEGPPYERDEIIAPQLTIDPVTEKQYLYYTGADYQTGWWVMLATKEP